MVLSTTKMTSSIASITHRPQATNYAGLPPQTNVSAAAYRAMHSSGNGLLSLPAMKSNSGKRLARQNLPMGFTHGIKMR